MFSLLVGQKRNSGPRLIDLLRAITSTMLFIPGQVRPTLHMTVEEGLNPLLFLSIIAMNRPCILTGEGKGGCDTSVGASPRSGLKSDPRDFEDGARVHLTLNNFDSPAPLILRPRGW